MKSINELIQIAHQNAIDKGWWQEERSFGELIVLVHAELSEAIEDYRAGKDPAEAWYEKKDQTTFQGRPYQPDPSWKPCGIPSELADVVIRIFDICGFYNIDLEAAISEKMRFNATRQARHGGKVI